MASSVKLYELYVAKVDCEVDMRASLLIPSQSTYFSQAHTITIQPLDTLGLSQELETTHYI